MYNATIKACKAINAEDFPRDLIDWTDGYWKEFVASFWFYADKEEASDFKDLMRDIMEDKDMSEAHTLCSLEREAARLNSKWIEEYIAEHNKSESRLNRELDYAERVA